VKIITVPFIQGVPIKQSLGRFIISLIVVDFMLDLQFYTKGLKSYMQQISLQCLFWFKCLFIFYVI